MLDQTTLVWVVLGLGALVVGLSKTAVPGAGTIAVALFASVLPAKESTGALLVLLIVGDMLALLAYRRSADWRVILRMAPAVVLGLVAGWGFLALASDAWVRRGIGVLLLMVISVTLWRRWRAAAAARREGAGSASARDVAAEDGGAVGGSGGQIAAWTYGSLGGFTTMVANAAGPVMSMYFLAGKFPVKTFLGTSAWFFAIVNLTKVPFLVSLGIINPDTLALDLVLVPLVLLGGLIGRRIALRMSQKVFERIVIVLTIAGALYLLR